MKAAITTSAKMSDHSRQHAKDVAILENIPYIERRKKSLSELFADYDLLYVWTSKGWQATTSHGDVYHYHPGTAMFRFKRWTNGEMEPFLQATDLRMGNSFVDCTMGFGADTLMASLQVGASGKVVGIEKSPVISFLFRNSQLDIDLGYDLLTEALTRIHFVEQDATEYLQTLPDESVDVIYLDPMFEHTIEESSNFTAHKQFAATDSITRDWIELAISKAKRRVVLKAHYQSTLFEDYSFKRQVRKTSKFHFGIYEKTNSPDS